MSARESFEEVSSLLCGLKSIASAAGNGASHSGSNEGRAVSELSFGVVTWCEVIEERMERLWRLLPDDSVSESEVSHAALSAVSHAKGAEVSHGEATAA
ncbi:hypothetical protein [Paraburkholderia sp. SOS3]|uniref:hypothetical protein n=1 Tax=Paraburkholderia sp. SOS3 TaxID=1926494 RepID=UPI0012EBFC02|nr:hypothetical protein [Paraburkholderia sp. SOS3]